jgi:P4 family phage/plasmid primase-like protien
MQLVDLDKTYAKSLGQHDVARVLLELVRAKNGFSYNGDLFLWNQGWLKYPIENFNEDVRLILRNKWSQSKSKFIRDSVLHNSKAMPCRLDGKIPFSQGYFYIRTGQFVDDVDFVKQNRILNHQTFIYDEDADCPNFKKALLEIFPDGDVGYLKRKAFLQFFAYCFVPINFHKALILFGTGANGKSTLLDVTKLFFSNHANIELQDFGDQNAILKLKDASMVYSHEGEFHNKAMSNFKKIAEGQPVLVNKKYEDKYWIEINCKMMIATNRLPHKNNLEVALQRRMVVIDMDANFIGRENFNLLKSFEAEKAGIFNLVIRELPDLMSSNGDFAYNYLVDHQLNGAMGILRAYICDLIEDKPNFEMTYSEFYDGYERNCSTHGKQPIGKSKVSALLKELNFGVERFNSAKNVVKVRMLPSRSMG